MRRNVSLWPQFGHSNSLPPSGKSGLDGSKKLTSPPSSIIECVNSKLQSSHLSVHRGMLAPLRPYITPSILEYSPHPSAPENGGERSDFGFEDAIDLLTEFLQFPRIIHNFGMLA